MKEDPHNDPLVDPKVTQPKIDIVPQSQASSSLAPLFVYRYITTSRKIDFYFLDSKGFRMGTWIRRQGWERFCSMDQLTYPRLVYEFYCSMAYASEDIMCIVKGVTFGLSSQRLSEIWGRPLENVKP